MNDKIQEQLQQICQSVLEVDHVIAIEKMAAYDSKHSERGVDIDIYR